MHLKSGAVHGKLRLWILRNSEQDVNGKNTADIFHFDKCSSYRNLCKCTMLRAAALLLWLNTCCTVTFKWKKKKKTLCQFELNRSQKIIIKGLYVSDLKCDCVCVCVCWYMWFIRNFHLNTYRHYKNMRGIPRNCLEEKSFKLLHCI